MNPVTKAVWYIESHFAEEVALDEVADAAGVSKYHLSRAFGLATGSSVVHYMRRRRLAEAARVLAGGAPDILAVALDAGYSSHEAFTRAFRDHFGVTPEEVRAQGSVETIQLTEPIKMSETLLTNLAPPRFVDGKTMFITGLSERYNQEASAKIPSQWQRFVPHLGHIPGQIGRATYGVLCNGDDAGNMDYICGVEVSEFAKVPKEWACLRIPEQRYAVFFHDGHISTIRQVWHTIWNKWLPDSGYSTTGGPEFERYDERFNPATGDGGFEIWIPIRPKAGNGG
jgi:AraC family transcriptional regulator